MNGYHGGNARVLVRRHRSALHSLTDCKIIQDERKGIHEHLNASPCGSAMQYDVVVQENQRENSMLIHTQCHHTLYLLGL